MSLKEQSIKTLFNVIPNAEQVLTPTERSRYAAIGEEDTKEKVLIEISELANILSESAFSVPIKGVNHSMRSERFTQEKEGNFTFKGSFSETMGELYIYATNGFVYGNIHIDSLAYQIEPVNKKYAMLLRRDYSGTTCPLGEEHAEEGKVKMGQNNEQQSSTISSTNPVIDVMVVFSNQAAAATSNMQSLAQGAIQSSNDSFSNSSAGVTFNLIHYQQISYNESGSAVTDRDRLIATSDGHMDNVHTLRDQHGADVVVLIVSNSQGYAV
tara:strand:- start:693 stop:1499 length:807 start_codon:yes stop_codon:yes gene_type:complete